MHEDDHLTHLLFGAPGVRVLFTDATNGAVVEAASILARRRECDPVLFGNVNEILRTAAERDVSVAELRLLDPAHRAMASGTPVLSRLAVLTGDVEVDVVVAATDQIHEVAGEARGCGMCVVQTRTGRWFVALHDSRDRRLSPFVRRWLAVLTRGRQPEIRPFDELTSAGEIERILDDGPVVFNCQNSSLSRALEVLGGATVYGRFYPLAKVPLAVVSETASVDSLLGTVALLSRFHAATRKLAARPARPARSVSSLTHYELREASSR